MMIRLVNCRDYINFIANIIVASLVLLIQTGCATRLSVEQATGESAKLEFRVLDNRMPTPMIYWKESPRHIETALVLNPPYKECEKIRVYANQKPDMAVELSTQSINVSPIQLDTTTDELSSWKEIPDKNCGLLVTVGRVGQNGFVGVSVSIPEKVIRRYQVGIQEDLAAKHRWWGMMPVAALFDVTHIPLYYAVGLIANSAEDPVEPVTVIFQFPDGIRRSTSLHSEDVRRILKEVFPSVLSTPPFAFKRARPWVRAALVELGLEFTEVADGEVVDDEWLPDSLKLKMVGGYEGNWQYRLDSGSEHIDDLTYGIGDASSIKVEMK